MLTVHSVTMNAVHVHAAAPASHREHRQLRTGYVYDSAIPSAIPANAANVAVYVNGPYATTKAAMRASGHHKHVLMIDALGTAPGSAGALDVEDGCASPATAASWVRTRVSITHGALARLYFPPKYSAAVHNAISTLPASVRSKVRYWEANPTGYAHEMPGTSATQYLWKHGYDVSKFHGDFMD